MYLTDFQRIDLPFSVPQDESLEWLGLRHAATEKEPAQFLKNIQSRISRVCCKQTQISRRYSAVGDQNAQQWTRFVDFKDRSRFFQTFVDQVFESFYPPHILAPDDLIHVTCTGYNSPSAAQKIVTLRGWEKKTMVTHAYHMGCMAAVPALRMALGFAASGKQHIDLVHTELCTLHLNARLHDDEQLVAQSLFADGLIKYSLCPEIKKGVSLQVLTIYEELIPNTEEMMKWECEEWGLKMTLSKHIPFLISRSISHFISTLEQKCGHPLKEAIYAIHPGGPRIIDQIRKKLSLSQKQIAASEKILYNYGNMSSATLPHVLQEILHDQNVSPETFVVGVAFGPGLCMSGVVLKKIYEN